MATLTKRLIRISGIVDQQFPGTFQDQRTAQTPQIVRGNASRFDFCFFNVKNEIYDLSLVQTVNLRIKDSRTVNTLLVDQTIDAVDLDLSADLASWTEGTKQHASFLFSNAEMNLDPKGEQRTLWLVVTAILTDGGEITLCAGNIFLEEDNNGTAGLPAENPGTPVTLEQADARYVAIGDAPPPLELSDDPVRPATATIAVTGNNTDSWSVISPGVPDVGASSSSYGGDIAKAAYIANAINGEPAFPFLASANTNIITLEAKAPGENGNGIAFGALGTGLVTSGPSLQGGHTEEAFVIGQSAIVEYTGGGSSEWVAIDTGSASNWMRRTATKESVGLDKVDNTSDLAKPISTLTQAGLNLKGNLTGGNTWSGTNNFQGNTPIILKNGAGTTWGTFDSITGTLFLTKIETSVSSYLGGIVTLAGNLASNIYPTSNNAYSIGNTTNRFGSAWFAGTVTMANAAISGTVSGAHSYSGQIELTGQAAPNPTSAMTRFLSRVDDRNVMRYVMPCQAPTISGVSFAGTGGGANQSTSSQVGVVQCGVANPGYATLRVAGYVNMTPGNRATVDFSRKFLMTSFAGSAYAGTTCEGRLFWPGIHTYTTGGMTYKGFGWLQVGNLLYGQTHDGTTLRTTAYAFTFPTTEYHHTAIYGDGAGNYSFYVNGTLLGTLAGPTGTQGLGGVASIILSAENKNAGDNMYVITNYLELSSWA